MIMKIRELLDGIQKRDHVLPEFQREYVWKKEQAKQLMVSLMRGYPVGGLLFWKTDNPPELKNLDDLPEKLGTIEVILDGQQRLTTLYMLINGNIPPYYTESDIKTDPRELYFNIEDGEFQYYQATRMKSNPVWFKVVDCFGDQEINVFEIAKEQSEIEEEAFKLAQIYNENLTDLRNINTVDLPIQTVPSDASMTEAIDIFDRVNSQGTKLSDAELALTHVTGKWAQARRVMKQKIDDLENAHYYLNLTLMTRALTAVVCKRALFEEIHEEDKESLEKGWDQLAKILDYLVPILAEHGSIHSNWDLNTSNVLIPIIVFLSLNDGKFPNAGSIKRAVHWLYAAHTRQRYSGQTDQKLEHDISLVVRENSPWNALIDTIIDQRGRVETKPSDMEGRIIQHPLYRMSYILAKAQGAVDWFNGIPIATPYGKDSWIQSHHIFPSSKLYENGYDPENHLHKKIVNEIANRAFITAQTNRELSNRLPEDYFPEVEEKYPGALAKQFIPMNPELWKLDRYPEFLEARRKLISLKLNEYMDSLITEPEIVHKRSIEEVIKLGESATLEFKSTLRWDIDNNKPNKGLQKSVLKTIVAFLNSEGGTLVIGVEDDGNVFGLENDLKQTKKSKDGFSNLLATLVTDYVGPEFSPFINMRFEVLDGKDICVVDVEKASVPSYLREGQSSEFYTRFGPTSRRLDPEETVAYINISWD